MFLEKERKQKISIAYLHDAHVIYVDCS